MLAVLSPSKTLDYDNEPQTDQFTEPQFLEEAEQLVDILREYDLQGLRELMDISEKLATLNIDRYREFETPFNPNNAKPAITAFKGDVYRDFRLDEYGDEEFDFLQQHCRILSGLYGVLRPLDLMQPYRLEMGTRLENPKGERLYDFWGDKITDAVDAALDAQGDDILLNLASNEYFDSIDTERLAGRILKVNFKDLRSGTYRVISFYLKRLRGTMTDWIVRNKVTEPEELQGFDERNYRFSEEHSTEDEYVFLRDEKP